ncbi:MAG: histidine--tRNA ligase [Deltaproteobacteria bacterium GWA2_38_16]|nr:MAG: histidine--tRNA ligase [Deltaproteobacteria bacterium GWA2_38_16]OGQ01993.1 MAG: histidine--tRNA ligase [Deltaproteobacteria bacterium RIFCSPHIGHO2_02_FULL_38_15]OGQ33687.1 MAG: histidine--tRNA ligase [Deltaproteobacteria bacterium RIFCSPLOWO2_01_FULL_38_9]HBQ21526.1 histidine--tRNA ligase [Deltaproteobacteria bacterium]
MSYTSVKGMDDLCPPESYRWAEIEKKAKAIFESFSFSPIVTPAVERTELFSRGIGRATDIVEKQMYTFLDKNGESLSLRPEGTAPVVRAYLEHQLYHPDPYQKFYYWGPMYRYERMQKGRYREFHQFGVEVFGSASYRIDAEIIFMMMHLYRELGVKKFEIQLNSLGCHECRPKYREQLLKELRGQKSALCADCQNRLEKNPLRTFDCKNEGCQKIAQTTLPRMVDHLCEPCKAHFEGVKTALNQLNTPFILNPNIVRGLDYYVRTTFEIVSGDLGAQNALGGGGRYDGLVKELGGKDTPAFGYAGGIERLLLVLENETQPKYGVNVFVAALGPKAQAFSYGLIHKLRLKGIKCEIDYDDSSLKAQMKKADRMNSQCVLIIGEDEMNKGEAILRNMSTKEQKTIPFGEILDEFKKKS